jgi:hypothetical protein
MEVTMHQLFRQPPTVRYASHSTRSAAVAKRRLHAALPVDRARAEAHYNDPTLLLVRLLQEDLGPQERRPS